MDHQRNVSFTTLGQQGFYHESLHYVGTEWPYCLQNILHCYVGTIGGRLYGGITWELNEGGSDI